MTNIVMNVHNDRAMLKIFNVLLLIVTVIDFWLNKKATFDGVSLFALFMIVTVYLSLTTEKKKKATPLQ